MQKASDEFDDEEDEEEEKEQPDEPQPENGPKLLTSVAEDASMCVATRIHSMADLIVPCSPHSCQRYARLECQALI